MRRVISTGFLATTALLFFNFSALAQITSIGNGFQITAGLSSPSGQHNPRVAFDGTDTYLVVWEEGANVWQNSIKQIYAARVKIIDGIPTVLDSSGIHLLSTITIQEFPKVAYGGGVFLVIWQQLSDVTDYDIKGVRVNSSGTVLDSSGITISAQACNQITPDITYDATNNRFFVVWADFRSNVDYQIYGARVGVNGVVSDTNGILMVDYVRHYGQTNYAYVAYTPVIQNNGQKLLLAFSERHRSEDNFDMVIKLFTLDGVFSSTVVDYDSTKIQRNYPEYGPGWPIQTGILTDNTDFLSLFRQVTLGAHGNTNMKYFLQAAYVQASGAVPNSVQTDIDKNKFAPVGCGFFADPYYYVFWEGISTSIDNYYNQKFGSVDHNIYSSRISKDGQTVLDYSNPIVISNSSAMELSPAVAKGSGSDALIVYEEDNGLSVPNMSWVIKARLLSLSASTLVQDGGITPEQISIFLPTLLPMTATATVRYKGVADSSWTTGHPLFRIRPEYAADGMPVENGFAWTIIGLTPGASYNVEVTTHDGSTDAVYNAIMSTRALPAVVASPTKTITAGSTSAQIQAVFDGAVPGDVIQFSNGIYNVTGLSVNVHGTQAQPIYIRGQSRSGVTLNNSSRVLNILDAKDIVIENMTIQGSGVDSGVDASSMGIWFWDGAIQERITIRNLTINGVDRGVNVGGEAKQILVYDNTLTGNNQWTQDFYAYNGNGAPGTGDGTPDVDQNLFWNDDGIKITGQGNAAFNNTLSGFGDALTMEHGYKNVGVHFYRNDVKMTGDDGIEADYGVRNITFYDNRIENAMTLVSCDPMWGGPFIAARNIGINIGRQPYKLNNTDTGMFFYNNTVVRTVNPNQSNWAWNQPRVENGLRSWGYQNNILILQYEGGDILAMEQPWQDPIDFTHNSWYPDGRVWWTNSGGSFSSLSAAYSGLSATTPVFSGSRQRHTADNISEANPFVTAIALGADHHTLITTSYIPALANGTAPKNSGVAIIGITDGFSGTYPDRGAIISGIAVPGWGDPSN